MILRRMWYAASHPLPLLLDSERGPYGTLGHRARANAQWTSFHGEREALVIFQRPHASITPSWCEPGLHVPTWNYAVAHAYGNPRSIQDEAALVQMLQTLVATNASGFEQPWKFASPEEALRSKLKGIVGCEMENEDGCKNRAG